MSKPRIDHLALMLAILLGGGTSCVRAPMPFRAAPSPSEESAAEKSLQRISWAHALCYLDRPLDSAYEVETRVAECKKLLLDRLHENPGFRPLGDYFEKYYPTASEALAALSKTDHTVPPPSPLTPIAFQRPGGFASHEAQSLVSSVLNWIATSVAAKLNHSESEPVLFNLWVSGNSHEVQFFLTRVDGSEIQDITTDDWIKSVYVGIYHYSIKFKKKTAGPFELDLVNWRYTTKGLSCDIDVPPPSTPCRKN